MNHHNGERVAAAFATFRGQPTAAFMPYWPLGYPTLDASVAIVSALAAAGADLLELGLPFSDPLADGPTIQAATQQALANGMNSRRAFDLIREIRHRGVKQPLLLMGYYNPILAYGTEKFCRNATAAGVDGFIIPDLPPEAAGPLASTAADLGLAMNFLLAPNSTAERIRLAAKATTGFLYLVSVTGITGAREGVPSDLAAFVAQVRKETTSPLAVGFGVSRPQQAAAIASIVEGVIVGSALVRLGVGEGALAKVVDLARSLSEATKGALPA